MRRRDGCGVALLGGLFLVACVLILGALAAALVQTGELPIYPPRLVAMEPEPTFPFRPRTPITLSFDQPMDPESVEAALTFDPPVAGRFEWNNDASQVTFFPEEEGFQPGTSYRVRLTADAIARTLPRPLTRSYEWGISMPPLLSRVDPTPGAGGLAATTVLRADFGYPLDCGATFQNFSITPSAVGVLGCKAGALTFSPTVPLEPGVRYVATLNKVYIDGDPVARPGVDWTFETASPLVVTDISPAGEGFLTDYWTSFRITFNRPVEEQTLSGQVSLLREGATLVLGQLRPEVGGTSVVFEPDVPLMPESQYLLVVDSGVGDELGFELAEKVERTYTTTPMLGMPLPLPGSQAVALDSTIRIPFTRPMNKESLESGLVIVPPLEGTVAWEEDTLVFTPRAGLVPETVYQVTLRADVRDATDAPLALLRRWAFGTQPFIVREEAPADAVVDSLAEPLELGFAVPVDRSSVSAALTISPTTPGTLVWSDEGRTVAFQPDPGWLPGVEYSIALQGPIRTAGGLQTVEVQRTYIFSTGVAEVQTGEGLRVEVMDARGARSLELLSRGADVADLALVPLDEPQLLEILLSPGTGTAGLQMLDTAGLTPTVEWRGVLSPTSGGSSGPWHPVTVDIPIGVSPGSYLFLAGARSEQDGPLVVVLTRHLLLVKESEAPGSLLADSVSEPAEGEGLAASAGLSEGGQRQVLAWDVSIDDGRPVVSSTVRLYDGQGAQIAQGRTGSDGLVLLELPAGGQPHLALADLDGDRTICLLGAERPQDADEGAARMPSLVYAYTDRPVYRPAETVRFKALVRLDDDGAYRLPSSGQPVAVELYDPRTNLVATQVMTPSVFGTVQGEFLLAEWALLGEWSLGFGFAGGEATLPFVVEKAPEASFEVKVRTARKVHEWGQPISVTVTARHLFGQPLAEAEVMLEAALLTGGSSLPAGFQPVDLGGTNAVGQWQTVVQPQDLLADLAEERPVGLLLQATVAGPAGERVTAQQVVRVQPVQGHLSLQLAERGYSPGAEIVVDVVVYGGDGEPVAGAALAAQALGWDGETAATAAGVTGLDGQAALTLALSQQGLYQLRVTADEGTGQELQAGTSFWIYDRAGLAPLYAGQFLREPALAILRDRDRYVPGDEAELVVVAPAGGTALLTVERGRIYETQVVDLVAGTNLITVPVQADYAPNVYVSASQFGDGPQARWHTASVDLPVSGAGRSLMISLDLWDGRLVPGEERPLQVRVTDGAGLPVVAEVSLGLIQDALEPLGASPAGTLPDLLYGSRANAVRTFASLLPQVEAGMAAPEHAAGDAGVWLPVHWETGPWLPAVVTDRNGRATVPLTAPGAPGEWQLVARAITTDTAVGEATVRFTVSETFSLRPVLPELAVEGDAFDLAVELHNASSQAVSVTLQLASEGLWGETERVAHVPAHSSSWVSWPLTVQGPRQLTAAGKWEASLSLQGTATRGARLVGRDAVQTTVPVYRLVPPDLQAWSGLLNGEAPTATIAFLVNREPVSPTTFVQVETWSSEAGLLYDGWAFLHDAPLPGAGQAAARVLATAVISRAVPGSALAAEAWNTQLAVAMSLGLQELYGSQLAGGGWAWGGGEAAAVDQTTHVLLSLALARRAGFVVDPGILERGAEALQLMLPDEGAKERIDGAYALATLGQPVSLTVPLTEALALDLPTQASLALALSEADLALAGAILENLRQAAIQAEDRVYWPAVAAVEGEPARPGLSSVGATARILDAFLRLDPGSPLVPPARRWLVEELARGGWGDPRVAGFALLALSDSLTLGDAETSPARLRLSLNGQLVFDGEIDPFGPGRSLTLPNSALVQGRNLLTITVGAEEESAGSWLLYTVTAAQRGDLEDVPLPVQATQARGIDLQRGYRLAGSEEPSTTFGQGDLVEVRLVLDSEIEAWRWVVEDPLPAGFRPVDAPVPAEQEGIRREVQAGRVRFFIDHLQPGRVILSYLVRAITAGDLNVPQARLFAFYEQEVWSPSASGKLRVEAR